MLDGWLPPGRFPRGEQVKSFLVILIRTPLSGASPAGFRSHTMSVLDFDACACESAGARGRGVSVSVRVCVSAIGERTTSRASGIEVRNRG